MHPLAVADTWNSTGSTLPPEFVNAWLMFPLPLVIDEGLIAAPALAVQLKTAPDTEELRVIETVSAEHHFRLGWAGLNITSGRGLTIRFPLAEAWQPAPLV